MTVIVVNGTSIQAAIDAASTGDEVRVKDTGSYEGFRLTKTLRVVPDGASYIVNRPRAGNTNGNVIEVDAPGVFLGRVDASGAKGQHGAAISVTKADVTLDHPLLHHSERGYGIRMYGAAATRAKLLEPEIHHVALGIHFTNGAGLSLVERPYIHDTDRMLVNTTSGGDDTGGMGMAFNDTVGLITVNEPRFERTFSTPQTTGPDAGKPASYDYGRDGAAFELFQSGPVLVVGGTLTGFPWIVETGRSSSTPAGIDCNGFTMRGTVATGQWPAGIPADPIAGKPPLFNAGFLLRSAVDFLIEECEFYQVDYHVVLIARDGSYATNSKVDRITVRNNYAHPKDAWLTIGANVPQTATLLTETGNRVKTRAGKNAVSVQGKGVTSDLPTYRGWAPSGATWGTADVWGPDVEPTDPPPTDPCAAVKAELVQAKADLLAEQTAHAVTRTQLAAAVTQYNLAETDNSRIRGIVATAEATLANV